MNAIIAGYLVHFVWRERRLIVEVDGYSYHRSPQQFERDVRLAGGGVGGAQFTWRQVTERGAWVAHAIG